MTQIATFCSRWNMWQCAMGKLIASWVFPPRVSAWSVITFRLIIYSQSFWCWMWWAQTRMLQTYCKMNSFIYRPERRKIPFNVMSSVVLFRQPGPASCFRSEDAALINKLWQLHRKWEEPEQQRAVFSGSKRYWFMFYCKTVVLSRNGFLFTAFYFQLKYYRTVARFPDHRFF